MEPHDYGPLRRQVLDRCASPAVAASVFEYCRNVFDAERIGGGVSLPLADEPHVDDWRRYTIDGQQDAFGWLQTRLPQLAIPIREGVSSTEAYGAVARRGHAFDAGEFGSRLALERPLEFRIDIRAHWAGALPVLTTPCRRDFETLLRALAYRSEPVAVSPAVSAQMIAGFINWDRVGRRRRAWQGDEEDWPKELQRLAQSEPWQIRDRFILTGVNPYSSVSAERLGLDLTEDAWLDVSTIVRVEHEFTHYATKRLYGTMQVNLLDELIADCMGFTVGLGRFRKEWWLTCLGLEGWPEVRPDGRVHAYRAHLDDAAFAVVCSLAVEAAEGVERVCSAFYPDSTRPVFFLALTRMTLELFTVPQVESLFGDMLAWADRAAGTRPSGRQPADDSARVTP